MPEYKYNKITKSKLLFLDFPREIASARECNFCLEVQYTREKSRVNLEHVLWIVLDTRISRTSAPIERKSFSTRSLPRIVTLRDPLSPLSRLKG